MYWALGILFCLIAFMGVIIIRTVSFVPKSKMATNFRKEAVDFDKALFHFSELLKIKTITYTDISRIDETQFKIFKEKLRDFYPAVHEKLEVTYVEPRGILIKWLGHAHESPTVLMSHYDVVPVDEKAWSVPAFSGKIDETYIWGRGTLDTKITLVSILESAEHLLADGFMPANDLYFAFGGDEEISGPSAPAIVELLKSRGVKPHLVLDEGGAIVSNVFPGVDKPCAFVGIGEKGYVDLEIVLRGHGGHSSSPPPQSLTQKLAHAITALEKKPFPAELSPPSRALFNALGRHSTRLYRMIFANLWCFEPLLKWQFTKTGGEMNALIRTTVAVTKLKGSDAFNILPDEAAMGVNMRLLRRDSTKEAIDRVKQIIGGDFEINVVESREASPYTDVESAQWQIVAETIENVYAGIVVAPYLMLGASDSRHYTAIADHILRFSPMVLDDVELGRIHSYDERISIENYEMAIQFFTKIMRQC
ncbi:M20/M25/M40 family metallo-hydrolase [Fusibacter paucivorans]|uniref:M20/M25/M40 family metallo-hydrolase n=1 Tax=Fusibacter paucivorans TaxID=76009 RepID=A0ABS5PSD1_9FIRM|nr:M20/M25/M40 family metallo-hydrolase [Fusibacter paucivorans]MBS7527817.1 M20/M25/M40 family metallo-hydrolase [Fusibacter paucivorans]